ncbi:MAG TPA: hypothetical protein VNA30_03265 [Mycobacteriales bacterium]|nr:hypothetical protein [Mycobacteriales bacterium]
MTRFLGEADDSVVLESLVVDSGELRRARPERSRRDRGDPERLPRLRRQPDAWYAGEDGPAAGLSGEDGHVVADRRTAPLDERGDGRGFARSLHVRNDERGAAPLDDTGRERKPSEPEQQVAHDGAEQEGGDMDWRDLLRPGDDDPCPSRFDVELNVMAAIPEAETGPALLVPRSS